MNSLPTIIVRPGEADRIVAGHPWLYEGAILRLTQTPAEGEVVQVKDHRQRFLGVGFFNPHSRIRVRMLERDRVTVDQGFFEQGLTRALNLRRKHLPGATSMRVVNAESDFLSGLIIDKYEDYVVLQISALGMERRKELIVGAIEKVLKPRAIIERSDSHSRKFEGLTEANGVLRGTLEPVVDVKLNGLTFRTDLLGGHKTGLYLDQQANYEAAARWLARWNKPQVLDAFTFLGAFALHAARAGAGHVHGLDQSEGAVAAAAANAEANGLADQCTFEATNVFDWLKRETSVGPHEKLIPQYDAIILDPPSFTRNRAAIPDALRGYKEIHLRSLKLLKPGGLLITFCCSHHVDAVTFEETILEAAFDAHRTLRRLDRFAQNLDHPVLPAIPETEYLKGFAYELV